MTQVRSLKELVGKKLCKVVVNLEEDEMFLYLSENTYVRFFHCQDCCESVIIEDICGDLDDLVDAEILFAEEVSGETPSGNPFEYEPESYTWTFYRFQTTKGSVDVRWYGASNGYYSERVDIQFVNDGRRVPEGFYSSDI